MAQSGMSVTMWGRISSEIKINAFQRENQSEGCFAKFSLAIDRPYSEKRRDNGGDQQEPDTDFFNVEVRGAAANFVRDYLGKSDLVIMTGHFINQSYIDKDGIKRDYNLFKTRELMPLETKEVREARRGNGSAGGGQGSRPAGGGGYQRSPQPPADGGRGGRPAGGGYQRSPQPAGGGQGSRPAGGGGYQRSPQPPADGGRGSRPAGGSYQRSPQPAGGGQGSRPAGGGGYQRSPQPPADNYQQGGTYQNEQDYQNYQDNSYPDAGYPDSGYQDNGYQDNGQASGYEAAGGGYEQNGGGYPPVDMGASGQQPPADLPDGFRNMNESDFFGLFAQEGAGEIPEGY